jgi:filamentous hemagglutinin
VRWSLRAILPDRQDARQPQWSGRHKSADLTVDDIDNRNGEISSGLLLNIKGQRLDNSDSGKPLAGTDLGLAVAELINLNKA